LIKTKIYKIIQKIVSEKSANKNGFSFQSK